MKETIEKAGNWASNMSSIGKLIATLIFLIVVISTAWYQIETNASDNVRQDENIKTIINNQSDQNKAMLETVSKEFKIQGDRSDKRYKRAMEEAKELHKEIDNNDAQILDLIERVSFMEGRQYQRDKN